MTSVAVIFLLTFNAT